MFPGASFRKNDFVSALTARYFIMFKLTILGLGLRSQAQVVWPKTSIILRSLFQLSRTPPSIRSLTSQARLSPISVPIYRQFSATTHAAQSTSSSSSSSTPPPPFQLSHKNDKGERILSRIVRAFTFSASSLIVIGATGVAALVVYLILSELLLPSGDTRTFNKAVKLVEGNEQAQKSLHFKNGDRLKAYGELPGDTWVRNRPVSSTRVKGQDGKDRLFMRFHVESDAGKHGSVSLEQIDSSFWSSYFEYVALDVPGERRNFIVESKLKANRYVPHMDKSKGFLGLNWGPKGSA